MHMQPDADQKISGPHFRAGSGPYGSVCGGAGDGTGKAVLPGERREQRKYAEPDSKGQRNAGEALWKQAAV